MKNLCLTLLCFGVALMMSAGPSRGTFSTQSSQVLGANLQDSGQSFAMEQDSPLSLQQFMQQYNITPGDNRFAQNASQCLSLTDLQGKRLVSRNASTCSVVNASFLQSIKWSILVSYNTRHKEGGWLAELVPTEDDNVMSIKGLCGIYEIPVMLDYDNNVAKIKMGEVLNSRWLGDTLVSIRIVSADWFSENASQWLEGTIYDDGSLFFEGGFLIVKEKNWGNVRSSTYNCEAISDYYTSTYLLAPNGVHKYTEKYMVYSGTGGGAVRSPGSDSGNDGGGNDIGTCNTTTFVTPILTKEIINGRTYEPTGIGGNRPGPIRPFVPGDVLGDNQGNVQEIADNHHFSLQESHSRPSANRSNGNSRGNGSNDSTVILQWPKPFVFNDSAFGGTVKPIKPIIKDTTIVHPPTPGGTHVHGGEDFGYKLVTENHEQPVYIYQLDDSTVYVYGLYGKGDAYMNYMIIRADGSMEFPYQQVGSNYHNYATGSTTPPNKNWNINSIIPGNHGNWTPESITWGKTVLYPSKSLFLNNKLYFNNGDQFGNRSTMNAPGISTVTQMIDDLLNGRTNVTIHDVTDTIDQLLKSE